MFKTLLHQRPTQGFTIVELLIVIVVIAILFAISVVAYNGAQDRAKATQAISGMEQYVRGLHLYASENSALPIPPTTGLITCFDGTVACNGSASQAQSTALANGIQQYVKGNIVMPFNSTLLTYSTTADTTNGGNYTGYYFLFSIPLSQTCPTSLVGSRFLNTSTTSSYRSCRYAIATPV